MKDAPRLRSKPAGGARRVATAARAWCGLACAIGIGLAGCTSSADDAPTRTTHGCPADGFRLASGDCEVAGLPADLPCPPGQLALDGGGCQTAGLPTDACAAGFAPGAFGCAPLLPSAPCGKGQIAVPGDATCRPISSCGTAVWGDIPITATTIFVDGSYTGADADGSQAKPWSTIEQAIDHATAHATIAVAAGTYAEDVVIPSAAPVAIWGRCPDLVTIAATGVELGAITMNGEGTSGSELHHVALTGAAWGAVIVGAENVVIDGCWIHDTNGGGVAAQDDLGKTTVTVGHTLVEATLELGILAQGAAVTVDQSDVRGTKDIGKLGRGFDVQASPATKARGAGTIRRSVIENNAGAGVVFQGSDGTIESSVIRGTIASTEQSGQGVHIQGDPVGGRSKVSIEGSLIEANSRLGVVVLASDADVEQTAVRATRVAGSAQVGRGFEIDGAASVGGRANVTLRRCLVDANYDVGIAVTGSDALLESSVVRDTQPTADGYGHGIAIQDDVQSGERATLTARASILQGNHESGLFVLASDATVDQCVVRDTAADNLGHGGRGITIQNDLATGARATLAVTSSLVDANQEEALYVGGSDATVTTSTLTGTAPAPDGQFGDGIVIMSTSTNRGSLTLQGTRIASNARAGVANFGGDDHMGATLIQCNGFDLEGETYSGQAADFEAADTNRCGCNPLGECQVLTDSLSAPPPLDPTTTP